MSVGEDSAVVMGNLPSPGGGVRRIAMTLVLIVLANVVMGTTVTSAADLSGKWRGRWESQTTGHQGPMSARFRKVDDSHYRVVFRGRFWKVIPFRYGITMQVQSDDGQTVQFAGSKSLGRLFGEFCYQAQATACDFHASYQSRKDRGTFELQRK